MIATMCPVRQPQAGTVRRNQRRLLAWLVLRGTLALAALKTRRRAQQGHSRWVQTLSADNALQASVLCVSSVADAGGGGGGLQANTDSGVICGRAGMCAYVWVRACVHVSVRVCVCV